MAGEGFEPSKAEPGDSQSPPNVPSDSIRSETLKVYENDRNWSIFDNLTK